MPKMPTIQEIHPPAHLKGLKQRPSIWATLFNTPVPAPQPDIPHYGPVVFSDDSWMDEIAHCE